MWVKKVVILWGILPLTLHFRLNPIYILQHQVSMSKTMLPVLSLFLVMFLLSLIYFNVPVWSMNIG
jgi:hypothetical protein